jgi:hypothetical protein
MLVRSCELSIEFISEVKIMKTKYLLSLILVVAFSFFMCLSYADNSYGGGDQHQGDNGGDQHHGNGGNQHHGHYGGNNTYHGNDWHPGEHNGEINWGLYYHNNGDFREHRDHGYTYQGPYGEYGDIFVFTDPDGREYDLYVRHLDRYTRTYGFYPLVEGDAYDFGIDQGRMYPRPDELKLGLRLNFKWGSVSLHKNYYNMYTSPELVNIRGRLYLRD